MKQLDKFIEKFKMPTRSDIDGWIQLLEIVEEVKSYGYLFHCVSEDHIQGAQLKFTPTHNFRVEIDGLVILFWDFCLKCLAAFLSVPRLTVEKLWKKLM